MAGPTSPSLALAVLVLLPFDIITWGLRFYVRLSRKAWGPDDWSMVAAIPLFTISTIGMLGIAFTGGGKKDDDLTTEERERAMFWWFIMQTMYCLAAIPVKWAICFTLLRIADKKKVYVWSIYAVMAAVAVVMASTMIYEFFHCTPIAMNWKAVEGGSCKAQSNITGFSYALSAVSIFSDWFCALIPIPLLWSVQLDFRVKISIVALLGLGVFASTAAIVRLTVTVNLSATTDFLYYAMPVAAWAHAELGLGVILANLPALRPLLEKLLDLRSTLRSNGKRTNDITTGDRYMELEEGIRSRKTGSKMGTLGSSKGNETRIYGGDLADSNSSLADDDKSTKHIVTINQRHNVNGIEVDRQVQISNEAAR
ncbi:Nn.00g048300.m01.CDS01 [Neocucurbitaria sp. VM-36]